MQCATDIAPDFVGAITADDIERGFDPVGVDRLGVVVLTRAVLRVGVVEIDAGTATILPHPPARACDSAAVLENRPGIGVVAQIEEVAVE